MLGGTEVAALLERHGLAARRSLGQNFVVDPNVVRRIVREAGVGRGDLVVEVGPGLGSLTLALVEAGAHVVAVEKDAALVPVLEEVLSSRGLSDDVELVRADALAVDWQEVLEGRRAAMVANLPYNVAVPVVLDLLQRAPSVDPLVVMVQREVADRLVAGPGGRTIGVPSVKAAWFGDARTVMSVPPEVFLPRPRVRSAVVRIDRRTPPSTVVGPAQVFPLVDAAYRQRRKMLRASIGRSTPPEAFGRAGVEPTARPEELDVAAWARLAEVVAEGAREAPG